MSCVGYLVVITQPKIMSNTNVLSCLTRDDFKTCRPKVELSITENLFRSSIQSDLTEEEEEILEKLNHDFVSSIKVMIDTKKSAYMSLKFFSLMQKYEFEAMSCSMNHDISITRYAFVTFSNVQVLTLNIYAYLNQGRWLLRHATNIKEIIFKFVYLNKDCLRYLLEEDIGNKNLRLTFDVTPYVKFNTIVRFFGRIHPSIRKYIKLMQFAYIGAVESVETYKRLMYFVADPSSSCQVKFVDTILSCDKSMFIIPLLEE